MCGLGISDGTLISFDVVRGEYPFIPISTRFSSVLKNSRRKLLAWGSTRGAARAPLENFQGTAKKKCPDRAGHLVAIFRGDPN
jgi:hypothetical protein